MKIRIDARKFAKFQSLQAEKSSIDKSLKELKANLGLPEATVNNIGEHVLVKSSNGDELGKWTVFRKPAFRMPACIVARIS